MIFELSYTCIRFMLAGDDAIRQLAPILEKKIGDSFNLHGDKRAIIGTTAQNPLCIRISDGV
jgi:hypothetical protein